MDGHQKSYREKIAAVLIKNLNKRRMAASYAPTALQARDEILAMIPQGSTVSRTGSMSLVEMGLWEELAKNTTIKIIDPVRPEPGPGDVSGTQTGRPAGRRHDYQFQCLDA